MEERSNNNSSGPARDPAGTEHDQSAKTPGSDVSKENKGGHNYPDNPGRYQGDNDYENGRTYTGRVSGEVEQGEKGE